MDFENTVDVGSAVNFGTDSGLRLSSSVLSEMTVYIIDLSSAMVGRSIGSSKLVIFVEQSSFKLGCVALFTISSK